MTIGPSAPMTTLTLPYLVLPLLKLLGRGWFQLDPAPPLLPSVEITGGLNFRMGPDGMGASKQLETVCDSV